MPQKLFKNKTKNYMKNFLIRRYSETSGDLQIIEF